MSKFKVGDRVKAVEYIGMTDHPFIGEIGTVESIDEIYYKVTFDRLNVGSGAFVDRELELITPAFAVGDTVEYKPVITGVIDAITDRFIVVNSGERGEEYVMHENAHWLTKITPPFPTRVGSHINAKIIGGNGNSYEFVLIKRDFTTSNDWLCLQNEMFYAISELELISVEYVPND